MDVILLGCKETDLWETGRFQSNVLGWERVIVFRNKMKILLS